MQANQTWVYILLVALAASTRAVYIQKWKKQSHQKKEEEQTSANTVLNKRYGPAFMNDEEIQDYLKMYGVDMMLWRCRNAIQPYWNWKPIPMVELYCEAIGTLRTVTWYHGGKELQLGGRFGQLIIPHYANGRYFARWIDFKLRIFNATQSDSGIYTFKATSLTGYSEEQMIYVDISEKRRKRRKKKKRLLRKKQRRLRMRLKERKKEPR